MISLPKSSRVVIIGGGIIGSSVAYHLSLNKQWSDITLLEQGSLTCGTTWHAAGLIGQMRNTSAEIELSKYGCDLYSDLEKEGFPTGWKQCGSLSLSSSPDRLLHIKRNFARAKSFGIDAELISPKEAFEKWPYFDLKDVNGALWLPKDGSATSSDVSMALANAAKKNGVKIYENVQVQGFNKLNGSLTGVKTEFGNIQAEVVVSCLGLWSSILFDKIPLHPCYHMYVITEPSGIPKDLPVFRDLNGLLYAREWSGGLCVGGFELNAKPCFANQKPGRLSYHLFDEDYEQFDPILQNALHRIPHMNKVGIRQFLNGPESFTIDNSYILGEDPYIKNLFLACGFNSSGIASAGGAGLALSEWIIQGRPTRDLWTVDPRRFAKFQGTNKFLQARVTETLGYHYSIPYPLREFKTGRNLRLSPLFEILKAKGAFFGNKFGWERVNCFGNENNLIDKGILNWKVSGHMFETVKKEHMHTRKNVSVFDQSSFAKYVIQGKDSLTALQELCCNNIDVSIGKIVYTGMLNVEGGYEADVTVTRISENEFFIMSSTANTTRDISRIKRFIEENNYNCFISDMTSAFVVLSLMGPKSRQLLEKLVDFPSDVSNENLPFSHSKELNLNMAVIRANRITYVGALGYELIIPTEFCKYVYSELFKVGNEFDLKDAGYYAIETLRLEKGYKAWGNEIKSDISPFELGLGFTIDWKKKFLGKEKLEKIKKEGIKRKIVSFTAEISNEEFLLGDEPIFRNNELVGYITSVKFGYSVEKWVGLCMIKNNEKINNKWIDEGNYSIECLGQKRKLNIFTNGVYDPKNFEILK